MRVFVVVNPRAGRGHAGRQWPRLRQRLAAHFPAFDHAFTGAPGDATRLVREAAAGGADLVIAVGGDGTISEAVNGLAGDDDLLTQSCAFAALSAGTGSDFVRSLRPATGDPIAAIADADTHAIDLGRVTYTQEDGRTTVRSFVNVAGFGLSGEVVRAVCLTDGAGFLPGKAAYYLATLWALASHRPSRVRLTIDDNDPFEIEQSMTAIANGRYFGGGMKIAPDARLDSGYFEVIILQAMSKARLVRDMPLVYRGAHMDHPMITARRGRRIVAEPADPGAPRIPVDIDGESPGFLKAEFEIRPGALMLRS